ncbi:MAG: hypothetical protein M3Q07_25470 [Pseudobdellovibrionaceae bacterium]|nr:hypothetical protein [Pseudobdellovibrionaceae bacterium]
MKLKILVAATLAWAGLGKAGSVGGGTPPSLELESAEMMRLSKAALKGDVIRLTEFGAEPIYMVPQRSSIRSHSLKAFSLDSANSTLFHTPSEAEKLQTEFGLSVVRSKALPGILPLVKDDLIPKIKPKVETVPASELEKIEE